MSGYIEYVSPSLLQPYLVNFHKESRYDGIRQFITIVNDSHRKGRVEVRKDAI